VGEECEEWDGDVEEVVFFLLGILMLWTVRLA